MTEAELIKGCINQDRRCQNELYERYFPLMSSIARRYADSQDDAVPLMNSAYLKILQHLPRYDKTFAFATFIRQMMINHCIDEFRKTKSYRQRIELREPADTDHGSALNTGASNLETEELIAMLNRLPEVTAKVFNLFAIDGFKHREIADMLGMSEGTSKWHVNEARRRLKDMLENEVKKTSTQNA